MVYENAKKNKKIYKEYKKRFEECREFTPDHEIRKIVGLRMSVRKFKKLEALLHIEKLRVMPYNGVTFRITARYKK